MQRGNYAKHAAVWWLGGPGRESEIAFYSGLAKNYGDKVLVLMCATGEVASGLAKNGLRVTGIDIEPEMIAAAQKNRPGHKNPRFRVGDVTELRLPDKDFDFIFIGTGDLHHLLTEKEVTAALTGIYRHLADRGGLALELVYPQNVSWQTPRRRYDPPFPPEDGLKTWKFSEGSYDAATMRQRIKQEVFIQDADRTESFRHELEMQYFSRATLVKLLAAAGFEIKTEYGGYDFSAWQPGAENWIVECVKINGGAGRQSGGETGGAF
ncbi:MAG: class I SAM-dependent methyltransferase [Dehalococcoidales bacterium]